MKQKDKLEPFDPRFKRWNIATQLRERWQNMTAGPEKEKAQQAMNDFAATANGESKIPHDMKVENSPTKAEMATRFAAIMLATVFNGKRELELGLASQKHNMDPYAVIAEDAVSLAEAIEARLNNQNAPEAKPDGKAGHSGKKA